MFSAEIAALFVRDLNRLVQEVESFPDDEMLWRTLPGVTNSAGNLALHLEGNLREYVGRQLGGVDYTRTRDLEFSSRGLARTELADRVQSVADLMGTVIPKITPEQLDAVYPTQPTGRELTSRDFLIHLFGHLSYHLGQVNYLRRMLTGQRG